LFGATEAEDTDRFRVVLGELASLSETTGQLQFRVRALEDHRLVDRCEVLEEKEGRINSEAMNHIIIKGASVPFLERGDDLQERLKTQVPGFWSNKFLLYDYFLLSLWYQVSRSPLTTMPLTFSLLCSLAI